MSELTTTSDDNLPEEWRVLQSLTAARIAIGRRGVSIPYKHALAFNAAHAVAREAVYSTLDKKSLKEKIEALGLSVVELQSKITSREHYLQRPDLGRRLCDGSLSILSPAKDCRYDISISIADGLSAMATNQHAVPLLSVLISKLKKANLSVAPVALIDQARVAIADEVGSAFNAKIAVIFIGERPGLSAADSLGIYLTYEPAPGKTDASRNCISNVRREGLSYELAADKLFYLLTKSLQFGYSGVNLKDDALLR